ncbi:YobH family protein, partial [Klebsiella pneumoniae]
AHDVPLGCAPDEYDDLISGTCSHLPQYLTARGVSTALYVHSDSGVIGVSSCPLLRKSTTVVDNG